MRLASIHLAASSLVIGFSAADSTGAGHSIPNLYPRSNHFSTWLASEHFSVFPRDDTLQDTLQKRSFHDLEPRSPAGGSSKSKSRSPSPSSSSGGRNSGSTPSPPSISTHPGARPGGSPRGGSGRAQNLGGTASDSRKRKASPGPNAAAQGSSKHWGAKKQRGAPSSLPGRRSGRPAARGGNGKYARLMPSPAARPPDLEFTHKTPLAGTSDLLAKTSSLDMKQLHSIDPEHWGKGPNTKTRPKPSATGQRPSSSRPGKTTGQGKESTTGKKPVAGAHDNTMTTGISDTPKPADQRPSIRPKPDTAHYHSLTSPTGGHGQQFTTEQLKKLFPPDPNAKPLDLSIDRPPGRPRSPPLQSGYKPTPPALYNMPSSSPSISLQRLAELFPESKNAADLAAAAARANHGGGGGVGGGGGGGGASGSAQVKPTASSSSSSLSGGGNPINPSSSSDRDSPSSGGKRKRVD